MSANAGIFAYLNRMPALVDRFRKTRMYKSSQFLILLAVVFFFCWANPASGQADRRDRREPELVVETGAHGRL